ncbi:hypothetical protein [Sphingomonas spermidinifaciens]|uniref:hypothetical protein n=1 Tax=Sphingomonas spermidinifaciens TaxID=1141889 RepID=UPI001FE9D6B6|nr:hypothetical protein [Sphingomonas spermidinifaciens]
MIAAVAAFAGAKALASRICERQHFLVRKLRSGAVYGARRAGSVGLRLVAYGVQLGEPRFQCRISGVGDAILDSLVKPVQLGLGLGCALAQLGEVLATAAGVFLAPVQHL